jgi:hypothetical protein
MTTLSRRVAIISPLRHRDFRLLWTGLVVSLLGDGVFLVDAALVPFDPCRRPLPRGARHARARRLGGSRGHLRIPVPAGHAGERRPDSASRDRGPVSSPGPPAGVAEALEVLSRAFSSRDIEAALACFADDDSVVYSGSEVGEVAAGRDELRSLFVGLFARESAYSWDVTELWSSSRGDLALVTAEAGRSFAQRQLGRRLRLPADRRPLMRARRLPLASASRSGADGLGRIDWQLSVARHALDAHNAASVFCCELVRAGVT